MIWLPLRVTYVELFVVAHDVFMWLQARNDSCYMRVCVTLTGSSWPDIVLLFSPSAVWRREREREVLHWPSSVIEDYSSCVRVCTRVCALACGWEGMVCRHYWWDIVDNLNQLVGQNALLWNIVDMICVGADDLEALCRCMLWPQMTCFYVINFIPTQNLNCSMKR